MHGGEVLERKIRSLFSTGAGILQRPCGPHTAVAGVSGSLALSDAAPQGLINAVPCSILRGRRGARPLPDVLSNIRLVEPVTCDVPPAGAMGAIACPSG